MLQASRSTAASSKNAVIACSKAYVVCKSHSCTESQKSTGVLPLCARRQGRSVITAATHPLGRSSERIDNCVANIITARVCI